MTLPSSGPLSLFDIKGEFGGSAAPALQDYYAGGAFVPAGTTGTGGPIPSSGGISIQAFYGSSNVIFSPAGGSSGSPNIIDSSGSTNTSVSISCNRSATWNWSLSGSTRATSSVPNGGSSTFITFSLSTTKPSYSSTFNVSATVGGTTKYWIINLEVDGTLG